MEDAILIIDKASGKVDFLRLNEVNEVNLQYYAQSFTDTIFMFGTVEFGVK